MARLVFGRVGAQEGAPGRSRLVHLDRDLGLVQDAQRDPERFEALYRKYLAQVYSFAYYELGDHHAAEDATERTFLLALTGLPRFQERARPADGEGASTFRVWLLQIARNVVANQRRTLRRHPEASLDAVADVPDPSDVERVATTRADASAAWRALGKLPADRRRALVLRFVDEMTTAEIAGVLGKSEGAVRVLIHRALRNVAKELGAQRR